MKLKRIDLPLPEGRIELAIDIYGRTSCTLDTAEGRCPLGSVLIEGLARRTVAAIESRIGGGVDRHGDEAAPEASTGASGCAIGFSGEGDGTEVTFLDGRGTVLHRSVPGSVLLGRWCDLLRGHRGGAASGLGGGPRSEVK